VVRARPALVRQKVEVALGLPIEPLERVPRAGLADSILREYRHSNLLDM
jgi:hypothetical protein